MNKILTTAVFLTVFVVGALAQSVVVNAHQPGVIDKNKVMDYFQNQEFSEAIDYLSPAVAADSGNVTLLGWAGYAYYMSDRTREAGDCFRRVVAVDTNNISGLHYLVLLELGEAGGGEARRCEDGCRAGGCADR